MRLILILGVLTLASAGCKSTPTVKEKPVADPLFTSKKPGEGITAFSRPARADDIPPPPAEPPRPDANLRLAGGS